MAFPGDGILRLRREGQGHPEFPDGGPVLLVLVALDPPLQGAARVVLQLPRVDLHGGKEPLRTRCIDGRHDAPNPL